MAFGPGKYDELTTYVRERASAFGAVVIIYGGTHGSGFSAQFTAQGPSRKEVARTLREVADQIESDEN